MGWCSQFAHDRNLLRDVTLWADPNYRHSCLLLYFKHLLTSLNLTSIFCLNLSSNFSRSSVTCFNFARAVAGGMYLADSPSMDSIWKHRDRVDLSSMRRLFISPRSVQFSCTMREKGVILRSGSQKAFVRAKYGIQSRVNKN